jgi:hypothetical protein
MNFALYEAGLSGLGIAAKNGTEMGTKVHLSFLDTEAGLLHHMTLDVFAPRGPRVTFEEMQKASRVNAIALLKEALSTLEKDELWVLEAKGDADAAKNISIMAGSDDAD